MSAWFARTDTSVLGRWWWTIDRWMLVALLGLAAVGVVLTLAASPPAAKRIGLDSFHFVRAQMFYLPAALALMVAVSLLSIRSVRRLAVLLFLALLVLTALTLVAGQEYKGASRWLSIAGLSLQPSEFLKPTFAVTTAWLLSLARAENGVPGGWIAGGLCLASVLVLMMQPDLGMTAVVLAIWFIQVFVAGLPAAWVAGAVVAGSALLVVAYFSFAHVANRIDLFLDPASGDSYQVSIAMDAFRNGGLFGRGPGEGTVKALLPDAHSDFVFAVAGEEFGLLVCLLIVALYLVVILRGLGRAYEESDFFVMLATTGLLAGFGLQTFVNMSSALHLIPTKGMTLPFLSYGGSSLLALGLSMGMLLALTRRRVEPGGAP